MLIRAIRRYAILSLLAMILTGCGVIVARARPAEQSTSVPPRHFITPIPSATRTITTSPTAVATPTRTTTARAVPTRTQTPIPTVTASPCLEKGRVEQGNFDSSVLGTSRPYRIYLPPCYDTSTQRYPSLYMFHGSDEQDEQWDNLGLPAAAEQGIELGRWPPFLIIMPAGDLDGTFMNTSGGPGSWEDVVVTDLIPFIDKSYRTLSDRRYRAIGGLSRGGYWSLEIAFRHPDLFSAVGGHSPATSVAIANPDHHPHDLARNSDAVTRLRIYLDIGDDDYLKDGPDTLDAILTARGIPHTYAQNPGTHEDAYWAAHVTDYLAFYTAGWMDLPVLEGAMVGSGPNRIQP